MKILLLKLLKIFSYLPLGSLPLRYGYYLALKKIRLEYISSPEISDILLTSQVDSKSFKYGHSDFNLLIIVADECHPKLLLKSIRAFIKDSLLTDLVINSVYMPILTESEFKSKTIKSYLVRKTSNDTLTWKSIFTEDKKIFKLKKQDQYALIHNAVQTIDFFLLKEHEFYLSRTSFKNISNAIKTLNRLAPKKFKSSKQLVKTSALLQQHFYLNVFYKKRYLRETWRCLTSQTPNLNAEESPNIIPLGPRLLKHLKQTQELTIIDDITVTPTIIQRKDEFFTGKIFLDLHLNPHILTNDNFTELEQIKREIKEFESENLKIRVRLNTVGFYELINERAFYPFPLEGLYRADRTYSLAGYHYNFNIDKKHIIYASIHFLTAQFMRFRSLEQKTELIGSKFIKSLNLMYKYFLLAEYLKGNGFQLQTSEAEIRSYLTPQFSEVSADDVVTEEHWLIIKAQLKYFLKQIRNELLKYDRGLRVLKF